MGSSLFLWATKLDDLCSTSEYSQFFDHYFMQTDVCMWTFIIGLGIAIVVCAIFYFGICNASYALSTRLTWAVALVIVGAATFFSSHFYINGHNGDGASTSSGWYHDSYVLQDTYAEEIEDDGDQLAEWNALSDEFRDELGTGAFDITNSISLVNTVYALLIFILMSFCVKGTTVHGKNIPV